jgi:hypothetical protein
MEFVITRPSREQLAKLGFGVLLVLMYDIFGFFVAVLFYFTPLRALASTLPQREAAPEQPDALSYRPALLPAYEALQLIDKAMTCQSNCGICSNPGSTNGVCNYLISARALIPHGLTDVFGSLMEELITTTMACKELRFRLDNTTRELHPANRAIWAILAGIIAIGFFVVQIYLGVWIG